MLKGNPSWASNFNGFLIDFWCQLQPHNFEKSLNIHLFYNSFAKSAFRSWHWFLIRSWCQHASIFPPKTHQKCIKTRTWKASIFWWIFASIFYRFSFDLGGQLGAMLASKTRPRRLQEASKMAPKTKCGIFCDFVWILLDFESIFGGFWWVLGGMLGWKIEPRAKKNRLKNASKK